MNDMAFNIWEGVYRSFDEVPSNDPSFLSDHWVDQCIARAKDAQGQAEGARIPDGAQTSEYHLSIIAALTARVGWPLRIVDFGGAAGDAYFALKATLPGDCPVSFYVVEHHAVCAAARRTFAGIEGLHFCEMLDELPSQADIVHAGSSLQYVRDWRGLLQQLDAKCKPALLVLSDVPAGDIDTFVTLQNYHGRRMPHWFWNLDEFVTYVEELGYRLAYSTRYVGTFLGKRGAMPTANFEPRHRLKNACHLVFQKI